MTKLVLLEWALAVVVNDDHSLNQKPSFTTPTIENNKLPMTNVVNDDH